MHAAMWQASVRLGLILSAITTALALIVTPHVSTTSFVVGVFLVASALGWANVHRFRHT